MGECQCAVSQGASLWWHSRMSLHYTEHGDARKLRIQRTAVAEVHRIGHRS